MASLILEAILNHEFGTLEQLAIGFAGIMKCADFVSDVFFCKNLFEQNEGRYETECFEEAVFGILGSTYFIAACTFTGIGLLFDAVFVVMGVKEWKQQTQEQQEKKEEDGRGLIDVITAEGLMSKKVWSRLVNSYLDLDASDSSHANSNWNWWKNLNFFVEDLPQLLILILFWIDWGKCVCSDDTTTYMEQTKNSVIVSCLFTSISMARVVIGYILFRINKERKRIGKEEIKVELPKVELPQVALPSTKPKSSPGGKNKYDKTTTDTGIFNTFSKSKDEQETGGGITPIIFQTGQKKEEKKRAQTVSKEGQDMWTLPNIFGTNNNTTTNTWYESLTWSSSGCNSKPSKKKEDGGFLSCLLSWGNG